MAGFRCQACGLACLSVHGLALHLRTAHPDHVTSGR